MRKIPTIFARDWAGTIGPPARFVLDEPHPDCGWVFAGEGVATRKLDGTSCLIRDGVLFKRHEVRPGKSDPDGFEEVELDGETGKRVGWVPVGDGPEDQWHREALQNLRDVAVEGLVGYDGTYELIGPKIQGNPEKWKSHILIAHTVTALWEPPVPLDYDGMKSELATRDIEGIVWHHEDGRMAKIKLKDFGLSRS